MNDTDPFVDASLKLAGLALDATAVERVKTEFARIAAIAAVLESEPLSHLIEPASTYRL